MQKRSCASLFGYHDNAFNVYSTDVLPCYLITKFEKVFSSQIMLYHSGKATRNLFKLLLNLKFITISYKLCKAVFFKSIRYELNASVLQTRVAATG